MSIALPLDQMTIAEKLEAMESLWADLSKRPADLLLPDWHRNELAERRQLADEGRLQFVAWDDAISQIRKDIRGPQEKQPIKS
jgi:hypothetical protein